MIDLFQTLQELQVAGVSLVHRSAPFYPKTQIAAPIKHESANA